MKVSSKYLLNNELLDYKLKKTDKMIIFVVLLLLITLWFEVCVASIGVKMKSTRNQVDFIVAFVTNCVTLDMSPDGSCP